MKDLGKAAWRRSTKCESAACVEIADLGDDVALRNSTDPGRNVVFSREDWRSFVAGVRAGEFDRQAG